MSGVIGVSGVIAPGYNEFVEAFEAFKQSMVSMARGEQRRHSIAAITSIAEGIACLASLQYKWGVESFADAARSVARAKEIGAAIKQVECQS